MDQLDIEESYYKSKSANVVMDYYDKKILAPMVRVGTLPMRLYALDNGCDIAYSEELIDLKLMNCKRVFNQDYNMIDFVEKNSGHIVYRTCEKDRFNVLQMGTPGGVTALKASMVVVNDVCAIDINMGCPKHFSTQGNMGSALLTQPETIKDILTTLIRNLPIPVTCKIRLLETDNATIDLLKMIEGCGVRAIGIHTRTVPERPRDAAHWDRLENILKSTSFSVPIIANGSIFKYEDIEKIKKQTNCQSVMIARGAIRNPALFKNFIPDHPHKSIQTYLKYAFRSGNHYKNTKFVVCNILSENNVAGGSEFKQTQKANDFETLCKVWGIYNDFVEFHKELKLKQSTYITNKPPHPEEVNNENLETPVNTKSKKKPRDEDEPNNNKDINLDGSDDEEAIERLLKKHKNDKTIQQQEESNHIQIDTNNNNTGDSNIN